MENFIDFICKMHLNISELHKTKLNSPQLLKC